MGVMNSGESEKAQDDKGKIGHSVPQFTRKSGATGFLTAHRWWGADMHTHCCQGCTHCEFTPV